MRELLNRFIIEEVVSDIIGSKQSRYGCIPSDEVLSSLGEIVRQSINADLPIEILVPWGASKQGEYGVDLAEMSALLQLLEMAARVKRHYPPGVHFTIRLEDLTDMVLFGDFPDWSFKTWRYCRVMKLLIPAILEDSGVYFLESYKIQNPEDYVLSCNELARRFVFVFETTDHVKRAQFLSNIGWKGSLPEEQIQYYLKAYRCFYPNMNHDEHLKMISKYFVCSLMRFRNGLTGLEGAPKITLSFAPPVPGVHALGRVYYRTMPERYTNRHKAPWLAKGYFRLCGDLRIPALAGWSGDNIKFTKGNVLVNHGSLVISVEADDVQC